MEIILSKQCESLTGSLGRGFGYHIQKRKKGFFAKRNTKGVVPPDGHWKFILACANLAQSKLHIADIRVSRKEFSNALWEAKQKQVSNIILGDDDLPEIFNAQQVMNLKERYNL